jgi:hypothetical protein
MTEYRVGQEVEVTYRARVAEVDAGIGRPRSGVRVRLEPVASVVTGWVDPEAKALTIKVLREPLPDEPGMYRMLMARGNQENMGTHHIDGYEFYYLNSDGNWCDVGWGQPAESMSARLHLMEPRQS